eukprot:2164756-Pleurochrysis_carterae.AAC.1
MSRAERERESSAELLRGNFEGQGNSRGLEKDIKNGSDGRGWSGTGPWGKTRGKSKMAGKDRRRGDTARWRRRGRRREVHREKEGRKWGEDKDE